MKLKRFKFLIKVSDEKKPYYYFAYVLSTYLGGAVRKWQQNNRISCATIANILEV